MRNLIWPVAACLLAAAILGCKNTGHPRLGNGASSSSVFQVRLVADARSEDSEAMSLRPRNNRDTNGEILNVQKTVLLNQTAVRSADSSTDARGSPVIRIDFTDDGGKRFAEITRQNIGKRLAIIIDGQLCQAPIIRSEIAGGQAQISGSFSKQETSELAARINGALGK